MDLEKQVKYLRLALSISLFTNAIYAYSNLRSDARHNREIESMEKAYQKATEEVFEHIAEKYRFAPKQAPEKAN